MTGDQFISSAVKKDFLISEFSGDTADMESAAIAQVCYINEIPFVVIRAMSDKADGSAHVSFAEFEKIVADNSSRIVTNMLKKI